MGGWSVFVGLVMRFGRFGSRHMGNGCDIYFGGECRIGWRMGVFDRFIVIAIELFESTKAFM